MSIVLILLAAAGGGTVYISARGVSAGQEMMPSDHNACRPDNTEAKLRSLCCCWPKLARRSSPPPLKMEVRTAFIYIFVFCGDYFLHFPPPRPPPSRLSPDRLRGYVTILGFFFFLNGYTCGTSGSKPDSLLTFLCSVLRSHGNCSMFGRKLLKAVERKGGGQDKERVMERGRVRVSSQ